MKAITNYSSQDYALLVGPTNISKSATLVRCSNGSCERYLLSPITATALTPPNRHARA